MTLRQVGERLGISFARVKQIEESALIKLRRRTDYE
ncbi:MAG: sigma factor-like helix-turn-helix DNA-binding protein [Candidatus Thorarchaeota archaeon]